MKVYIVGEDPVTYAIIRKVLAYCSNAFEILAELPARGGQVKSKIPAFNKLAESYPVVLLMDLDNHDCAPQLQQRLIPSKNRNFIFNIAVDEAEAWLMADREGFARYFKIALPDIPSSHPTKQGGRKALPEMKCAYKSSMFLTHELIMKSKEKEFIRQVAAKAGAAKGPEYNSCLLPFVENIWNIENARNNTDSLNRMIIRLQALAASTQGRSLAF
jgi:hypothetical protein